MLVITRKKDESVIIEVPAEAVAGGKTIEIAVLETSKDKVKLGVNASREVKIIRSELVMAKTFNVEASKAVSKGALDALMKLQNKKK
jgi:carbon storage regulator